jgi:hypothetical protein
MPEHTRTGRARRRLAAVAAGAMLALTAASSAGASSSPVPDFNDHPNCIADILAISCFVTGTASGGGKIVSWEWEYPGAFSNQASGKSTTLRFESVGVFDVTLTVVNSQGETGSVTKPMVVEING